MTTQFLDSNGRPVEVNAIRPLPVTVPAISGQDVDNNLLVVSGAWALTMIPATAAEYTTPGADRLHGLMISTAGGGSSTISLYNGSADTGTLIFTWTGGAAGLVLVPVGADADFPLGLTVLTAGGGGAAPVVQVLSLNALAAI